LIVNAQDPVFSQFFSHKLYLNPAFAGNSEHAELYTGYRNQFPEFDNAFNTFATSYHIYSSKLHGGLGFVIMNDVQSDFGIYDISASAVYSYHLKVSEDLSYRMGFETVFTNNVYIPGQFSFPSMTSSANISSGPSLNGNVSVFLDFSLGGILNYRNLSAGFSVSHIGSIPVLGKNNSKIPLKYTAHLNHAFDVNPYRLVEPLLTIYPVLLFQKQGANQQINYGMYFEKKSLTAGVWLKHNLGIDYYSAALLIGYNAQNYSFAYSYDFFLMGDTINFMINSAHEVTFVYKFRYKEKVGKIRAIKCPKF